MSFLTAVDIANRALQHVGALRIDSTLGFSENSKNASECSFCYDKLRQAELRANVWQFATRKTAIRPIDTNTLLLVPSLWSSGITYFVGSIVEDATGQLWSSRIPNNKGNNPQTSLTWEEYFGPLTVSLYDSSQFYWAGELVYTAAGNGTSNIYQSQVSNNAVHPALPNQWSTFTTYNQNNVVQAFPAWSSGTTYSQGQTVQFTDGLIYSSLTNSNLNHQPSTSATSWSPMPTLTIASQTVPISSVITPVQVTPIAEWSQTTFYVVGSFVMFNGLVYVAISSTTGNFPNAAGSTFWIATSGGTLYMSLIELNIGNNPATTTVAAYSAITTYAIGNQVTGSDGFIYTSLSNANLNHDPTTDLGVHWQNTGTLSPWTTVFTQGGGNQQWMQIGGASFPGGVGLAGLNIVYPLNSGPIEQMATRNIFRLPAGYLRVAPQDPKAGVVSYIGAPQGLTANDWEFENDFIVSREFRVIVFRFVADTVDVTRMDPMFCEGLAARMGAEICEPLTQSTAKLQMVNALYKDIISRAKTVNGIETGAEQPPEDDWISARV